MRKQIFVFGLLSAAAMLTGCTIGGGGTNQPTNNTVNNTVISGTLKVCPDLLVINQMPTVIPDGSPSVSSGGYYILNGKRREIAEFDAAWVAAHCKVPEQTVS